MGVVVIRHGADESKMRMPILLVPLFALACGGLIEIGAQAQLQELHRENECAKLIQAADESYSFIADRPDLVAEANFLKGDCLVRMGKVREGIALFRYVVEQHPTSPFAYRAQARVDEFDESGR